MPTARYEQFAAEQKSLNAFLWSSEVAVELVRQRILPTYKTNDGNAYADTRRVAEVFETISCNAFIPAVRPNDDPSMREPKYRKRLKGFEKDLGENMKHFSRIVIVSIHSAFERYMKERIGDLLKQSFKLTEADIFSKTKGLFANQGGVALLPERIEGLKLQLSVKIPLGSLVRAAIYSDLRNALAHADGSVAGLSSNEDEIEARWRSRLVEDAELERENRKIFKGAAADLSFEDCRRAIKDIVEAPRRKRKSVAPTPAIFFNALFALGAYQKLAASFDEALPDAPMREQPTEP